MRIARSEARRQFCNLDGITGLFGDTGNDVYDVCVVD